MTVQISCPQCNHTVNPDVRNCEECGIDLAMAAAMVEHALSSSGGFPKGAILAPEVLIPRLGEYLIEKGMVKPVDLQRALDYQEKKLVANQPLLIGQALVELGLINRASLDEAVTEQILQLQLALQQANRQLEQRVQERTADLQRALNKLTELNQLKSNFISNISHELRTPLTHLKGYVDILSDQSLGPLTPQQKEALLVLKRAENRLEHLIDDLIQFALAVRGELSLRVGPFKLEEVIHQTITQSTLKARAKGISFRVSLANGMPNVEADKEKIGWVLAQLLDNAIKFTPRGGRVGIESTIGNGIVLVEIKDTGIGIPAERIPEIFEPFHQLDGSVTRRYPGTGLGLAMVRQILEAHGASIKVDSILGKGSRFIFSLPIHG